MNSAIASLPQMQSTISMHHYGQQQQSTSGLSRHHKSFDHRCQQPQPTNVDDQISAPLSRRLSQRVGRLRRRAAIVIEHMHPAELVRTFSFNENDADKTTSSGTSQRHHHTIYRPLNLQTVIDETHFSRDEIRSIYRAFKETAPSAILQRDRFREMFGWLFPNGDPENYADLVFETFDVDQNGHINFQEFVKSLSILSRGNIDERLDWLYRLYDSECTGAISWERLYFIISSVDDMIGPSAQPVYSRDQKIARTNEIFQKFNGKDGKISKHEFMEVCRNDQNIRDSILFDFPIRF